MCNTLKECMCGIAVRSLHAAGCVSGQGAARPDGGTLTPLVPPATLLLESLQGLSCFSPDC